MESRQLKLLNKVSIDEFGRVNGILVLNKPTGITSHDLVDIVRKKLETRKVGHAGALDPFASGLMLILVGKYTKQSDYLTKLDKEYKFRLLLGVSTDTQDTEGKVTQTEATDISKSDIKKAVKTFKGGYEQLVPIFSSVKVGGKKLRELARKAKSFKINPGSDPGQESKRIAVFKFDHGDKEVEIPRKSVKISKIKVLDVGKIKSSELEFYEGEDLSFTYVDIVATVSKGTYIRQLAEDIGGGVECPRNVNISYQDNDWEN